MTFRNLMIAETLVSLGFGLVYLFYPQMLIDDYLVDKTPLNSTGQTIALHYGTLMVSVGIAAWFSRNAQPSVGRRALLIITCLSCLLVCIISFYLLSKGIETSAIIWTVIIPLAFMGGWAGWLLSNEAGLDLK